MKLKRFYLVLMVLALGPAGLQADEDRWGVGFHPVIGYDPDADWTFGVSSAFYFNPDPDNRKQELDELNAVGTYSLDGGFNIGISGTKNLQGNDRVLDVGFRLEKTINDYYGMNGELEDSNKVTYAAVDFPFSISYSFKAMEHLYVSGIYEMQYHGVSDVKSSGTLAGKDISDNESSYNSGVGIGISYKTTNPGVYKRKGYRLSLSSICYSPVFLGQYSYELTSVGWKYYKPVLDQCVLGFHLRGERVSGNVPVSYYTELGGSKLLRGFSGNRYIGRNNIAGQIEFRFPIWWRTGATVFGGVGEASNNIKDFGRNVKAAGGIGFRIALKRKQNLNLRFDFAWNSDGDTKKYIKLKEAF